jgi:hypothetical protein
MGGKMISVLSLVGFGKNRCFFGNRFTDVVLGKKPETIRKKLFETQYYNIEAKWQNVKITRSTFSDETSNFQTLKR